MKFLSLITGLSWQTKLIAIIAVVIASFAGGWQVHGWRTDAKQVHSINRTEKTRQNDIVKGAEIIKTVEIEKEVIRYVTNTIIKEIPSLPDADNVCFTAESLSMWNQSISAANQLGTNAVGKAEAIEATTSEGEGIATVTDVLENAVENNQICAINNANHNALIDRLELLKGKMCYCAE